MAFDLKKKFDEAKETGAAALAIAVMTADGIAASAREKTAEIRERVETGVAEARFTASIVTALLKDQAIERLGRLGEVIEEKTGKFGGATAEFGRAARQKLTLRKPGPTEAEAEAMLEQLLKALAEESAAAPQPAAKAEKPAAQKPEAKKPAAKKPAAPKKKPAAKKRAPRAPGQ